jgi:histone H4
MNVPEAAGQFEAVLKKDRGRHSAGDRVYEKEAWDALRAQEAVYVYPSGNSYDHTEVNKLLARQGQPKHIFEVKYKFPKKTQHKPMPKRSTGKRLDGNIKGITKNSLRRLARRGGVKRVSAVIYEEARAILKNFVTKIKQDAVAYTEHAKRNTVTAADVINALRRQGKHLYGYT